MAITIERKMYDEETRLERQAMKEKREQKKERKKGNEYEEEL